MGLRRGNLLISSCRNENLVSWRCRGEVGEFGANAMDHGENELFDFLRLDFSFGEELGGSEAKLGHLGFGDLAAGVDDQRQSAEGGLLTEPFDEREAVAVGQSEV